MGDAPRIDGPRVQKRWHIDDHQFEQTARNGHGVRLIARDAVLLDDALLIYIVIYNDSEAPYRAAQAHVTDVDRAFRAAGELKLRVKPSLGCMDGGVVAPDGQCRGVLRIHGPDRFADASLSVTVSEASGARAVSVEGLAW
jgi:hypothetical protein